jgi:hypothetical protein
MSVALLDPDIKKQTAQMRNLSRVATRDRHCSQDVRSELKISKIINDIKENEEKLRVEYQI